MHKSYSLIIHIYLLFYFYPIFHVYALIIIIFFRMNDITTYTGFCIPPCIFHQKLDRFRKILSFSRLNFSDIIFSFITIYILCSSFHHVLFSLRFLINFWGKSYLFVNSNFCVVFSTCIQFYMLCILTASFGICL